MSFGSRIVFGGLSAWFSRGLNILLNVALMPILFRNLPKEELGVWLLLAQSWAALSVFDFGFGIILSRRIAFAVGKCCWEEVAELVGVGRRVYLCLSIVAFGFALISGFVYISGLELNSTSRSAVWGAWTILCLGQAIGIWASVWTCLLQGMGLVGWDSLLASISNSLTVILQIAAVLLGGGLISLALIAAGGAVAQRCLFVGLIRWRRPLRLKAQGKWNGQLFVSMLSPAARVWLTSFGYLLAANTDQFFLAAHQGPASIPAYRAAFVLLMNLHVLSGVFSGASPMFVSQLWQAGELGPIRSILRRNAILGLLAMGCGGAVILVLGPAVFDLWLGAGNFVGYPVLVIFLGMFILEHHANVFSTCGRATNDEAYGLSSIAGGVLKIILAYFLISRLGLAGLALSTLLAQGLTNNWYMVYRSARRLGVDLGDHTRRVLVPVMLVSGLAFGMGLLVNGLLWEDPTNVRVVAVSLAGAVVLALSGWRLVLERDQREWVLRRLRLA